MKTTTKILYTAHPEYNCVMSWTGENLTEDTGGKKFFDGFCNTDYENNPHSIQLFSSDQFEDRTGFHLDYGADGFHGWKHMVIDRFFETHAEAQKALDEYYASCEHGLELSLNLFNKCLSKLKEHPISINNSAINDQLVDAIKNIEEYMVSK